MQQKMILTKDIPQCNFCPSPALYDAPTSHGGSWAHMCAECAKTHGGNLSIGCKFKAYEKTGDGIGKEPIMAKEKTSMAYWKRVMDDGIRQIICPRCNHYHSMEPDAAGKMECHSCGQKLIIPEGLC
jgi:hypothetical protein